MFGTSGVRGPVGETVTSELALDIAHAVAVDADHVVIGRDARDTGRALLSALQAGLVECGVDVTTVGVAATPTIARAVGTQDADAGIAVTASHNPPADNGLKLWTPSGQAFDTAQQERIERLMETETVPFAAWDDHGSVTDWTNAGATHRASLVEAGRRRTTGDQLSELHVVVDVGTGTGSITADALYELGATVETLNAQPDGRFPARDSEPTAAACAGLIDHVVAREADLGIAHDGDADRMRAVAADGQFLSGDTLLAVFACAEANAGDRVAAPVNTSLAVDDALEAIRASLTRTRVGDVYVAERTREPDVVFGGEPSGAWIFPRETRCPDGPLAAIVLAALVAERPLTARVAEIPEYSLRREAIDTGEKRAVMERIRSTADTQSDAVSAIDGVRVSRDAGWFLIRASGTQPLVRVTAEAREADTADQLFAEARELVLNAVEEATDRN